MKKTLFSALALVALMTACRQNDTIVPRPAPITTTQAPVPTTEENDRLTPADKRHSQTDPESVGTASGTAGSQQAQSGATPQTSSRDAANDDRPDSTFHAPGRPAKEVMAADSLISRY